MITNKIKYSGIARAVSDQEIKDGFLDELMNLRHRQGKLQPVGNPTKLYNLPSGTYTAIWKHEQDNIDNYIGLTQTTYQLKLINMSLGSSTFIKGYSNADIQVITLKRFLIVIHDSGIDRFLYKDNAYSLINYPDKPDLSVYKKNQLLYETDSSSTAEAILGKYYAKVNQLSKNDGKLTGGIMYRAALRMFDGSYVLHTLPRYEELGLQMIMTETQVEGEEQENDLRTVKFYASNLEVKLWKTAYSTIDTDIFTHIVIFACKNQELYEFNSDTFDEDVLEEKVTSLQSGNFTVDFEDIFDSVNTAYKNMADSPSWYKIHEIDIKEVQDSTSLEWIEDIDMKDFYQDYATREVLTVDQFSHHSLIADYGMNYNSRLILSDVQTLFGSYATYFGHFGLLTSYPMVGYTFDSFRHTYLLWTLKTDNGEKYQLSTLGNLGFSTKTGEPATKKYCMFPPVIGYPDSRATKLEVLTDDGTGQYCKIASFNLNKSKYGNYAYYHSETFDVDSVSDADSGKNFKWNYINSEFTAAEQININLYTTAQTLSDSNRIQISELNNPFYFPAENSYTVGTGSIIACASNSEPLSTGQYGEHPLIVFSTKGIWCLYQGHGDVLFSAVKPVNGEVALSRDQIISTGQGVTYTTDRGLYFIQGMKVTELTELLIGMPNTDIQAVDNYTLRLNHISLVQLSGSLSTVDAKNYLSGAIVAFDKKNNELLVTNNSYEYSYVYSFDSGYWHKKSESYRIVINAYPELLCLREGTSTDGVYSLSQETYSNNVSVMLTTRPCKLDNEVDFTVLHRAIQRCEIETGNSVYAGFYVFGSNDLQTWQLLQGNDRKTGKITDIFTTRSHGKCKYYVFLFAAILKEYSVINTLDIQFYHKLTSKIR